jgi:membrane-associated phospholipid phosphatase
MAWWAPDEVPAALLGPLDRAAGRLVERIRPPWSKEVANRLSWIGDGYAIVPPALAVGMLLGWRRRTPRPLLVIAAASATAILMSETTKALTGLTRPRNWEAAVGYRGEEPLHRRLFAWTLGSFPSGHVVMTTAVWRITARMVRRHLGRGRTAAAMDAMALSAVTAVATSRLALGVHWLSDVLGGVLIGESAVHTVLGIERLISRRR